MRHRLAIVVVIALLASGFARATDVDVEALTGQHIALLADDTHSAPVTPEMQCHHCCHGCTHGPALAGTLRMLPIQRTSCKIVSSVDRYDSLAFPPLLEPPSA